ncbi:hypothetical protein [Streptomyces sp. NPDC049555]|uniref:hypothetical protein n=1 Tax=Streptomyces sp. NPDC049555 TaxID=3154930 RepID=UPI00343DB8B1
MSYVDLRPSVQYGTIDVGTIVFSQRPHDDGVVVVPGAGIRLNSDDPSACPAVRLEHLSQAPENTPPGHWDYQRSLLGVTLGDKVSVLSLFGDPVGQLELPNGRYDLRLLMRRDDVPVHEEDPPQFIDPTYDEDELDDIDEEPVEHWLIQFWPSID